MNRPTTGGRYIRKNGELIAAPERATAPEPELGETDAAAAPRKSTRAQRVADATPSAESLSQAKPDAPNATEDNPS